MNRKQNLEAASLVKSVADDDDMVVPVYNNFIPFAYLHLCKDSLTRTVDIVGVALHMLPVKEQITESGPARLQEIIVINTEMQPMKIILWNDFIETKGAQLNRAIYRKPEIVAKCLKVVSFYGLLLTTKAQSSFAIDPDVPQANEMQVWLANNLLAVNRFMNSETFNAFAENPKGSIPAANAFINSKTFSAFAENPKSMQDEFILIAELPNLPDNRKYRLYCALEVVDFDQAFWYMACDKCHRGTTAAFMEVYTCNYCKRTDAYSIPRCRFHVLATDSSGTISASLFGTNAERFLGCTAVVMESLHQDGSHQSSPLLNYRTKGKIKAIIRPYRQGFRGESIRKFDIAFKENEEAPLYSEASMAITPYARMALFQADKLPPTPSKKRKERTHEVIAEGPYQEPLAHIVDVDAVSIIDKTSASFK